VLLEVLSGAERLAVAGDHHHPDGGIRGHRSEHVQQGGFRRAVEGVESVRTVQGDRGDAVADSQ